MAMRAREIYYFIRVGNYATRPLRALQADFHALGRAGDAATARLERLNLEQQRLARSIAMRRATIPAMQQSNALRLEQAQLGLQRQNAALANRRAAINTRIAEAEYNVDKAIAQGNILERERTVLQEKNAATALRTFRNIRLQQARVAEQIARTTEAQALIPQQRRITELGRAGAIARRRVAAEPLAPAQRAAALQGRISRSPDIARMQARFIAAEKAVQSADLALKKLTYTEASLAEKQQILSRQNQVLAASEKELQVVTQQQALALERLDQRTIDNAAQVDRYRRQIQEFTVTLQQLAGEERRLSVAEQRLIEQRLAAAASIAKESEALQLEVAQLARVTEAIFAQQAAIRQHRWDRIALGARALSDFGRTAQYAGGITVLAFAAMAHEAAKFKTEVALAATQVGNNFRQVQVATGRMMKGILSQMKQFPASASDMAKASYDIFSSLQLQGTQAQQTAKGLGVLRLANKAAVAGQANLVDVTHAGITILNDFGKANKDATVNVGLLQKFLNRAFAAVRYGRMTFQEFTQALTSTAPAAKAANQTFDNMSGSLAFLTTRIPSVRTAGIAYARLLEVIQRAGAGLKERGIDIKNTAGLMRPLDQIMKDIVDKFPAVAQGRKTAIEFFKEVTKGTGTPGTQGTIQARRAFVFLATQQQAYRRILRLTIHDQGEFWKSFRALQASPEVKWRIFVNQLHAMAIEIGQYAIPALLKMIKPISDAVKWFERLDNHTKKSIATFGIWAGGITLVVGTLSVLLGTLTRMIGPFRNIATAMAGAKGAEVGLAAEAGFITVETAGLLAVVAGLLALWIKYPRQVNAVVGSVTDLSGISKALHSNIQDLHEIFYALRDAVNSVIDPVQNLFNQFQTGSGKAGTLNKYLQEMHNWMRKIAGFGPIKIVLNVVRHGPSGGIPGLPNIPGQVQQAVDTIRHPLQAALSHLPGAQHVRWLSQMVHNAAALSHHFNHAKNSADDLSVSVDQLTIKFTRMGRALARALDRPLSKDPMRQARGGPAIAANQRELDREARQRAAAAIAAAKKHAFQQVLNNRSVKEWIRLLRQANAIAAKHPRNLKDQLRAIVLRNQLEAHFTGAQLQAIEAVVDADNKATKKRIKNTQDLAKSAIDNMKQVYDELLQKNQEAFGSIADGVRAANALEWGGIPRASDLLKDLQDQVRKFERWRNELMRLRRQGLPAGLVAQLQEAGPEKEGIIAGLLKLTPKQRAQYIALWKRAQQDIKKATAIDFNVKLDQWRSHGRKAALLFMKGMRDEGSFINAEMKKIFLSWLKGGNRRLPTGQQTQHADRQHRRQQHRHRQHRQPRHRQRTLQAHNTTINHKDEIHIHNNKEDLSTSIRKARLQQKNRRANRLNWGVR